MSSLTLLLIDDEPAFGQFVQDAAALCGYETTVTLSADAFQARFRACAPSVVALDLGMPKGDGIEILRFLADENCTAPILIMSGFDDRVLDSSKRLGQALGLTIAGALSKPIRLAEIIAALQAIHPAGQQ